MNTSVNYWEPHPNLLEINTRVWLNELSANYNKEILLDSVPEEIFDTYLNKFDAIWLMGVWERSLASKKIAQEHLGLQREFHDALDDYNVEDVIGSPYAVYYYHVDSHLGGTEALLTFRENLKKRHIKLILDYIPNHVAKDHLWTLEGLEIFVEGTEEDLRTNPDAYFKMYDKVYAHGKDPNFPPWTDTIQINAFSQRARIKAINTLLLMAEKCDGVRCDMAMLMTNEIFKNTWKDKVEEAPEKEFWEEIIPSIKEKYPEFKFIGEVYWDMEWNLLQQGFDYCYDKRLYDRIMGYNIKGIKDHLTADFDYQKKLVRFIENHDEPRAAKKLDDEMSKAAAVLILTLPGMGLIHEGQMKGYNIRIPIQLKRRKEEEKNKELFEFYQKILEIIAKNNIKAGQWELCEGIDDENIISYHWWNKSGEYLIVINMSNQKAKPYIKIPHLQIDLETIQFKNLMTEKTSRLLTDDVNKEGRLLDLDEYGFLIFQLQ
jgi:glycosidase